MTEDELRDLDEQNAYIQEIANLPGWQAVSDFILSRAEPVQAGLISGAPKDYEEYRERVGWVKGVLDVLKVPEQSQERVDRLRAELEQARAQSE